MAERHPTPELKARILEALYQKHGYTQGDEDLPMTLMDRHRVFVRKREAEKEYAEYEESLKLKPQIVPTTPEQLRLAEERRLHPLDKWQRTTLPTIRRTSSKKAKSIERSGKECCRILQKSICRN